MKIEPDFTVPINFKGLRVFSSKGELFEGDDFTLTGKVLMLKEPLTGDKIRVRQDENGVTMVGLGEPDYQPTGEEDCKKLLLINQLYPTDNGIKCVSDEDYQTLLNNSK